jgi:two-component system chemotaxis response regulator CheY
MNALSSYLNKRVMIVEDSPAMRVDLVNILKGLGFTNIKEIGDGKAAWDELRIEAQYGTTYDLIFSDINMPIMNGLVLLKQLRSLETYKKTPIFMVSTENERDVIIRAIIDGATDYILKPYDPKVVVEKMVARLK